MLLDTYAWVEFFKGTEKGRKVNSTILKEACFTSAISLAELTEWCFKDNLNPENYLKAVKKASTVIDLDESCLELAGKLNFNQKKKIKNWGMIDSIILATAKTYNLRVITGDKHFQEIEGSLML